MEKKRPNKPASAANAKIETFRYDGTDRREGTDNAADDVDVNIRFDAKGNPVWEMRAAGPRRRKDDDTLDLLKCLNVDSLSIDDGQQAEGPTGKQDRKHRGHGYDPYDRDTKK